MRSYIIVTFRQLLSADHIEMVKRVVDVTGTRGNRHVCKLEWVNLREEDHFQDMGVDMKAGHVAGMGDRRVLYRFLVGKPEGK
jgi:hypothetical protein